MLLTQNIVVTLHQRISIITDEDRDRPTVNSKGSGVYSLD